MNISKAVPIMVVLGAVIGVAAARACGTKLINGFLIGELLGFSPAILLLFLLVLHRIWLRVVPELPACRCGHRLDESKDYVAMNPRNQTEQITFSYQCRACQRNYLRSSAGVFEITADLRRLPFMRQGRFGTWVAIDPGTQVSPSSATTR